MTTAVFLVHNYINYLICKKISTQYQQVIFISDRRRLIQEIRAEFGTEIRDFSVYQFRSSLNLSHSKRIRKQIKLRLKDVKSYEIFVPNLRNRVGQVLIYDNRCTQFSLVEEGYPGPYLDEKTLTEKLSEKVGTPHLRRLVTNALYVGRWVDFKYLYYHHPKFSGNAYCIHAAAFADSPNQIVVKNIFPKVKVPNRDILVLPNLPQLKEYLLPITTIVNEHKLNYFKPHPSNEQSIIDYFLKLGLKRITTPLEVIHQNSNSNFHVVIYQYPGSICHYTAEKNLIRHQLPN